MRVAPEARRRPGQRRAPRGFVLIGTLALALAAVLAAAAAWYWPQLPPLDKVTEYRPRQHLQVFDADGVELAQFGSERRIYVPLAQMPRRLVDAVLAIEDSDFYAHGGISWRGLVRAALAKLSGGRTQGASTITQQVARTFFLSMKRTPERKIKEALLAWQIEQRLSKDRILELYLNQIYLGQRSYGFAAAAQTYFGKTLDQLSLAETALLAGLPKNPIHANPAVAPERAQQRALVVLARMEKLGLIGAAEHAAAARETPLVRDAGRMSVGAEHAAEMVRRAVYERLGERAYTEGIRVYTALRAEDQRAAAAALRRALRAHEERQPWRGPEDHETLPDEPEAARRAAAALLEEQRDDDELHAAVVLAAGAQEVRALVAGGDVVVVRGEGLRAVAAALSPKAPADLALRRGAVVRLLAPPAGKAAAGWRIVQWPQAQGAFVALDPAGGRIRALVGGFDFDASQFNHVTQAWRQPGSSIKPFLYSAALEQGVMPATRVDDLPLTAADGATAQWNPGNSDGRFDGEITVREALVRSKNLASIRLLRQIGLPAARAWLARFGLDLTRQPDNLTLALGTGSVTPLQMAAAYAVFANGGHRVSPVLIERITDARGEVLFEAPPAPPLDDASRVIPERNAFLMETLMADVTRRGTGARAQAALQRPDLYGKTGTTDGAVDAWFAGFQPGVVAVVWIGYDEPASLGTRESGAALALPVWIEAMARMLRGVPVQPLAPPPGVVEVDGDWRYDEWAAGGFVARIGEAPAPAASVPVLAATAGTAPAAAAAVATTAGGASAPR